MQKSLTGVNHLSENDIIDIFREHFAKYGFGFKRITFAIDQAERGKPRFEIDIQLDPLNKMRKRPNVEKVYSELMAICLETASPQKVIMKKLYELVQANEIDVEEFSDLIDRIKGQ